MFLEYRYKVSGTIFRQEMVKTVPTLGEAESYKLNDTSILFISHQNPSEVAFERVSIINIFGVIAALIFMNLIGVALLFQINNFFLEEL